MTKLRFGRVSVLVFAVGLSACSAFQTGVCPPTGIAAVTMFNKATAPFDCVLYPAMNTFWPSGAWTLEGWVYIDPASRSDCCGTSYAFDSHDSSTGITFGQAHHADYILLYIGNHVGGGPGTPLNREEWYHLAYAFDGSSVVSVYHDGVFQNDLTRTPGTNSVPMSIGCRPEENNVGQGWVGRLSDFRLWNVKLSEAEIQANMLTGGTISDSRLKHRWTLSNTFTDSVGSAHSTGVTSTPSFVTCPEITTTQPPPTTTPATTTAEPTTQAPTQPPATPPPPVSSLQLQHENSALTFGSPEDAYIYRVAPGTLSVPGKLLVDGIDVGACCSGGAPLLAELDVETFAQARGAAASSASLLSEEIQTLRDELADLRRTVTEMQAKDPKSA